MLKYVKFLLILLILAAGSLLAFIYSGVSDVAATAKESHFTRWVLGTVRERSIESRLGTIQIPALNDPAMISNGARDYHDMCEVCHLAPGVKSSDIRAGLNPHPPELARAVPYSTPAELFWVVKNGIKMTGMPAWGVNNSDQKLWDIIAFLQQLPRMTPAEYHSLIMPADNQSQSGKKTTQDKNAAATTRPGH